MILMNVSPNSIKYNVEFPGVKQWPAAGRIIPKAFPSFGLNQFPSSLVEYCEKILPSLAILGGYTVVVSKKRRFSLQYQARATRGLALIRTHITHTLTNSIRRASHYCTLVDYAP